jgi:23S rRNA (guanosine2251-2'-O)-methyltransferase
MSLSRQAVYGINPVTEAILAGKEIERIYIGQRCRGEGIRKLKELLQAKGITWTQVPEARLQRLAGPHHQGVVCFLAGIEYQKAEILLPQIFEAGRVPLILMLDRITDVRNMGAISRTAYCMGVDFIVIPSRGAAIINADAIKASAGALHHLPIVRENNLQATVQFLKDSGLHIVGCTEKASLRLSQYDFTHPVAIILGSEENGIDPRLLRLCHAHVKIPQPGPFSSLNVSVAAGMALYEVMRQRLA